MSSVISVDYAADRWAAVAGGHVQRVDYKCGVSLRIHRPAYDPAAERVQDRAAVQSSFSGAVLGDIGDPQLIWGQAVGLAVDQIISCGHPA